jgi:hypothetical protein
VYIDILVFSTAALITALRRSLRLPRHLRTVHFLPHFAAGGLGIFWGFSLDGIPGLLHDGAPQSMVTPFITGFAPLQKLICLKQ